jgi:O-antigen/teichoic acid export membrane protein
MAGPRPTSLGRTVASQEPRDIAALTEGTTTGGTLLVVAGNAAYALAQAGVLIVLAKVTSPAEVGRYALALAITTPLQLGLRLRLVRAVDHGPTPLRTYLKLALLLAAGAFAVSVLGGLMVSEDNHLLAVVILVALSKAVEGLVELCYGEYQRQDRLKSIATSQLLRALVTVVLAAGGAILAGLIGALVALVIGWSAQLLLLDRRRVSDVEGGGGHPGPVRGASELFRKSWPLGAAGALASLTVCLPRFVVHAQLDEASLGLFAILTYPAMILALFASSVGQARVRSMSTAARSGRRGPLLATFVRTLVATLILGAAGAAVVLAVGPTAVVLLLGDGFAAGMPLLLGMVLVATLSGLATNAAYLLVSTGSFGLQPLVIGISLAATTPLLVLATERHGLLGTAAAMATLYALQGLLSSCAALTILRRHLPAAPEQPTREEIR